MFDQNLIILTVISTTLDLACWALPVHIITIALGDSSVTGYRVLAPALDVAFSEALRRYPMALANATRTTIYRPGNWTCADSAALMPEVAGQTDAAIRRLHGLTIVISTGCSLEALALADFAREWNVPMIVTATGEPLLTNRQRYPALVQFDWDNFTKMRSMLRLLKHFQWTTITLLCDSLTQQPGNSINLISTCGTVASNLRTSSQQFTFGVESFDSRIDRDSLDIYKKALRRAAMQSRANIVISTPARIRYIMVAAHQLNMTNGDYIYIAIVSTKAPGEGEMTWRANDEHDEEARAAFESLIFLSYPNPNWGQIGDILSEIANRSATAYNHTLDNDTYHSDKAIEAYEAVTCLTRVINDTFELKPRVTAADYYRNFVNRTFDVKSRSVTIGSNGAKVSYVTFLRLNRSSGEVEIAWRYFSVQDNLEAMSALSTVWRNGIGPPANSPACGFQSQLCFQSDLSSPTAIVLYILLGLMIIMVIVFMRWKMHRDDIASSRWWILNHALFGVKRSPTSIHISRSSVSTCLKLPYPEGT